MTDSIILCNKNKCLIFLALVRRATIAMMVDGLVLTTADVDVFSQQVQQLAEEVVVDTDGQWFYLAQPDDADRILREVKAQDEAFYQRICELVFTYILAKVQQNQINWLEQLRLTFIALADYYLYRDKTHLQQLITCLGNVYLNHPAFKQTVIYYQGLLLQDNEQVIAHFETLLQTPDLALWVKMRVLNSCAIRYRKLSEPEQAIHYYQQSLAIARQLNNRSHMGNVLYNMAVVVYLTQRYDPKRSYLDMADAYLNEAMVYFEQERDLAWIIATRNIQGIIFRDRGEWEIALAAFEEVLAYHKATAEDIALAHINIGEVKLFQAQTDLALYNFKQAVVALDDTHMSKVDAYIGLGLAHQIDSDFSEAQTNFQRAFNLVEANKRNEILPQVYYHLGDILRLQGDSQQALIHFIQAAGQVEQDRPRRDEHLKIGLFGRWQQIYERLVLYCLALGLETEAFEWAERARARALADALQADNQLKTKPATLAEIQAKLSPDELILSYFTTGVWERETPFLQHIAKHKPLATALLAPSTTLLFAITATTLHVEVCNLDPNDLTEDRDPIQEAGYLAWLLDQETLTYLYQVLLKVVIDNVTPKVLYIIPHGTLHQIPFAALVQTKFPSVKAQTDTPALMYPLSATIFAQDLKEQHNRAAQAACLVIGYNGDEDEERRLLNGEAGAQFFADVTEGQALLNLNESACHALKTLVSQYRWLHFNCHGQFDLHQPLASYLKVGHHQKLSALDILQTWQLGADLVILSACQTGVSRILRGDEPMGLARAFLYAGAKTILVTLWKVPEFSTLLLMQHFYKCLGQGMSLATALSVSQDWLRNLSIIDVQAIMVHWQAHGLSTAEFAKIAHVNRPFVAPEYWAGFVLIGSLS